jgi:hypothetical protein
MELDPLLFVQCKRKFCKAKFKNVSFEIIFVLVSDLLGENVYLTRLIDFKNNRQKLNKYSFQQ